MHTVTTKTTGIDWNAADVSRSLQNIRNLMLLLRGEIAYTRSVGINPEVHHMPSQEGEALLISEVYRNIEENQPDATALEVRVRYDSNGAPIIEADVEIEEGFDE